MATSEKHAQLLLNISMAIGNSMDINTMLKESIESYLIELEVDDAFVVMNRKISDETIFSEIIFKKSIGVNNIVFESQLSDLLPKSFSQSTLKEFCKSLPNIHQFENSAHAYLFLLPDFGFLFLVKNGAPIALLLQNGLLALNKKLSQATLACINLEKLEESQMRYRDLSELLPEMVCEVDLNGYITYVNNFAQQKMGYSNDEINHNFHFLKLFPISEHQRVLENYKNSLANDLPDPRDYTIQKKDGTQFQALVYTNRIIKNSNVVGLRGVMVDITSRKEIERKLQLSVERIEMALVGSDAGLWDWELATGNVFYDEKWCHQLGYQQYEMIPTISAWRKLIHPDDVAEVMSEFKKHFKGQTPLYTSEHRLKTQSGDYKWIRSTGKITQRDMFNKPIRAVGTHVDITDKKEGEALDKLEHELGIALSKLENLKQTLMVSLQSLLKYTSTEYGEFYLFDDKCSCLVLEYQIGDADDFISNKTQFAQNSFYVKTVLKGQNIFDDQEQKLGAFSELKHPIFELKAILPIFHLNKVVGAVNLYSQFGMSFSPFQKIVMHRISNFVGSFITKAEVNDRIQRNQQDLNTLFNTIDDYLFILSMDGRIVHFNSIVLNQLGYVASELINQHFLKLKPVSRQQDAIQRMHEMLEGTKDSCEIPLLTKTGIEIPVETKMRVGVWNGQKVMIGISRNIYERINYERQIKQDAERLEMAILASNAGLWDWTINTGELLYNSRWYEMRGYTKVEYVDHLDSWKNSIHADDRDRIVDALYKHVDMLSPIFQVEYRTRTKQGNYIWVLDTGKIAEYDGDNNPVRMVGTNIDITSRKDNELALRQSFTQQELLSEIALELNSLESFENQIESVLEIIGSFLKISRVYIFENSDDELFTTNTFEWCNSGINPKKEQYLNVPYTSLSWFKSILIVDGRIFVESVDDLSEKHSTIFDFDVIKSFVAYPLIVHGRFMGFIGFNECSVNRNWSRSDLELLRTVSGLISNALERKNMGKSIRDERDRANQANQAKSEFLANMSHEIRTPMNAILGFSEALYHKLESQQHRKMIKSVLNSGNLLLSLLNDILDLSKIEAGKLEIFPQPIELTAILSEITLIFSEKANKKGIEINLKVMPGFPEVLRLDEIRIKQVLFNLVGNAIKFTHHGHVLIEAQFENTGDKKGTLIINVADTGIGIQSSEIEVIFEAFKQQSGQSNRKYGGTGLGLAISARLAEKMNGEIIVSSQIDKGSVFTVRIPDVEVVNAELRKREVFEENRNIVFDKSTILVIDDVSSNIETVESLLFSSDITISSAENGEMGLEVLNHINPDVILLDIRMPGIDGYEVAHRIKSNPDKCHIPIVAFTASVLSSDRIENSSDFDGLLFKPVSRAELYCQLAKFLKYKTIDFDTRNAELKDSETMAISDELKQALPEIIKELETAFLPKWVEIKDQLILFRMEEFANELKQFALLHKLEYVLQYTDKVFEELDSIDLESLSITINQFPTIIENLKIKYNE